ncbi:hypothetical protein D3C73_665200 [compost metagenome]
MRCSEINCKKPGRNFSIPGYCFFYCNRFESFLITKIRYSCPSFAQFVSRRFGLAVPGEDSFFVTLHTDNPRSEWMKWRNVWAY